MSDTTIIYLNLIIMLVILLIQSIKIDKLKHKCEVNENRWQKFFGKGDEQ